MSAAEKYVPLGQVGEDGRWRIRRRWERKPSPPRRRAVAVVPPIIRDVCGTYGGYQKHKRLGETACHPCRQANATYMREYRSRDQP